MELLQLAAGEEDLERSPYPSHLDFTPQLALVTADTVHDEGYVPEVVSKLFLQGKFGGGDDWIRNRFCVKGEML